MTAVMEAPRSVDAPRPTRTPPSVDRFGVDWRDRVVGVVGMARSGRAACQLLNQIGCRVRVSDRNDTEATRLVARQLLETGVERVELGDHSREIFHGCDVVVVSPGVPESALPVRWAQAEGLPILSEVELAFRFCAAPIVAVTGTNGKSSAVTLIHQLLNASGRPSVACGNLGIPFSTVIPTATPDTTVVVEVSSFQLLWCHEFRPNIGVLLNLGTNHLDRHADYDSYVTAKAKLFAKQTRDDFAVLNSGDAIMTRLGDQLRARRVWFGESSVNEPRFALESRTRHTLPENFQAVLQVGRILGFPDPFIYQTIREFRGLEHRIEYVATVRGVRFINDSKSTTPESCVYALNRSSGPVVPIIGGKDKGLDFRVLRPTLSQERVRGVVLIGESRPTLRAVLDGVPNIHESESLEDALRMAMTVARPGDTVLFSPACASFDMFRDFEERGAIFKQLVRRLASSVELAAANGAAA